MATTTQWFSNSYIRANLIPESRLTHWSLSKYDDQVTLLYVNPELFRRTLVRTGENIYNSVTTRNCQ